MSAFAKIRKALNTGDANDLLAAMDALAELERATEDPVGWQWLNTCHYRRYLPDAAEQPEWRPLYTTPPPAPVAPGMFTALEMAEAYNEGESSRESGELSWYTSDTFKLIQERTQ